MLELDDITYTIDRDGESFDLIHRASLKIERGHFTAIVGPSGCGKTTLLKLIAGIHEESGGHIFWDGKDVATEKDLEAAEIGYVPQFSIAFEHLTVAENIESAIQLRVRTRSRAHRLAIAHQIIHQVGLNSIAEHLVKVISGGQKRRLGLALELVSNPTLLLCDEVTSGLDPKAEREIVRLMHSIALTGSRVVINVTHSLGNLEFYDSVLVMYQGCIAYHGPPDRMTHYFGVEHPEEVYPRLATRDSRSWHASWTRHRAIYYDNSQLAEEPPVPEPDPGAPAHPKRATASPQPAPWATDRAEPMDVADDTRALGEVPQGRAGSTTTHARAERKPAHGGSAGAGGREDHPPAGGTANALTISNGDGPAQQPGPSTQFRVLLARRWKIFFRDRAQIILHLGMLLGFPLIVVLFGINGIAPLRNLSDGSASLENLIGDARATKENLEIGAMISGLVMFQVILLTLMGSNSSAREIASERLIYEKEKLGGLAPSSYIFSKVAFLSVLVLVQSVWMSIFIQVSIPSLPGDATTRTLLLILVNGAMTATCLGISALTSTPEQATLLSIYVVGFQLPLSGAVLALPSFVASIVPSFISAYWGWGGILSEINSSDYSQAVKAVTRDKGTDISGVPLSMTVLGAHMVIGVIVAYIGAKRHQWDHQQAC